MRRLPTFLAAALALAAPASASAKDHFFHSPTGNIECEVGDSGGAHRAYCQTNSPGRSATLTPDGKTKVCSGTKCLGNGPEDATTLNYGKSVTVGRFKCTSAKTGMTCVVAKSGHGFTISTAGVKKL